MTTAATPWVLKGCFARNFTKGLNLRFTFYEHDAFLKAAGGLNHLVMFVLVFFL